MPRYHTYPESNAAKKPLFIDSENVAVSRVIGKGYAPDGTEFEAFCQAWSRNIYFQPPDRKTWRKVYKTPMNARSYRVKFEDGTFVLDFRKQ